MQKATAVTITHVVATSQRPYEQVKASLEVQMPELVIDPESIKQSVAANASWDQIRQAIEQRLGGSGLGVFSKVEQGELLSAQGKRGRAAQYSIGNPLLAIQMIVHDREVALYAPLRLAIYENEQGGTSITYDRFTSVVAPYRHPEIARVAEIVEQKLEDVVASALGLIDQASV
jgi:uncharacterized protein (DUF302 family)